MSGSDRYIHYVDAGNGLCAMIVRENGASNIYYVYSDHLGSLLTLTDEAGAIVARQNFDAWGRYRNPDDWTYSNVPANNPGWLYRGYTGHEHLSPPLQGGAGGGFALINMNGRMYDPVQGRMMSPDNYVPSPWSTQGYNRFSYANNNPLVFVDPDGNFWFLIPLAIGAIINVAENWNAITQASNIWSGIGHALGYAAVGAAQGAANYYLGPIAGGVVGSLVGGFGNGALNGQSIGTILSKTTMDLSISVATAGIGKLTGGVGNLAGDWTGGKIGSLTNNIIGKTVTDMVSSSINTFISSMVITNSLDLVDGGHFNFGSNISSSFANAGKDALISGASTFAQESLAASKSERQQGNRREQLDAAVTVSQEPIQPPNAPLNLDAQPMKINSSPLPNQANNMVNRLMQAGKANSLKKSPIHYSPKIRFKNSFDFNR